MNTERIFGSDKIKKAVAKGIITASGVVFVASVLGGKDTSSNTSLVFQEQTKPESPNIEINLPETINPEVNVTYPQFESKVTIPYGCRWEGNCVPLIEAVKQTGDFMLKSVNTRDGEIWTTLKITDNKSLETALNIVGSDFEHILVGAGTPIYENGRITALKIGKVVIYFAKEVEIQDSDIQEDRSSFESEQALNSKLVKGRLVMMFVQKDARGFTTGRITLLPAIKTGSEIIITQ